MEFLYQIYSHAFAYFAVSTWYTLFWLFFPLVLLIELPFYLLVLFSVCKVAVERAFSRRTIVAYTPRVSCLVTCYNEGEDIYKTISTLEQQIYAGVIEIFILVDGASQNKNTLDAAHAYVKSHKPKPNRVIRIISKMKRGGHASSLNLGLKLAKGELVIALDGDCSCDNDMLAHMTQKFADQHLVGLSGTLRVRNAKQTLLTRFQAIEYMVGIHLGRLGLSTLGCLNNISGAFGVFRREFLLKIGGWRNGTGVMMKSGV